MPEETNRVVTDHLSGLLFCPTRTAIANLAREGISAGIHLVGDLMYDATLIATPIAERKLAGPRAASGFRAAAMASPPSTAPTTRMSRGAGADPGLHRGGSFEAADRVSRASPAPSAALAARGLDARRPGLIVIDPVGYLDMCKLLHHAAIVLTDSGGVQKEAYFHRVPCVTLRDETEWTETVECG